VFWDKDEWHKSGTGFGLTAFVLEGELLDPGEFMLELNRM
jgi:hypothetical protein